MKTIGTISFFCGKMGAGKTTYAKQLAQDQDAIFLSEDVILSSFYPDEIHNITDYVMFSNRIKPILKRHIVSLLLRGDNVVLDFPGNTLKQRQWFSQIIQDTNAPHVLYYLDVSDELCLKQLMKRREEDPARHAFDTEEVFRQISTYFQIPTTEEGFEIKHIIRT